MPGERVPWITDVDTETPPKVSKVVERKEASIEAVQEKKPTIDSAEDIANRTPTISDVDNPY